MNDVILAVLSDERDDERVVLVHRREFGNHQILLRRESFSDDVGWFEQSSVAISPDQVGQLKQALGLLPGNRLRGPNRLTAGSRGRVTSDCG
jgi:hypothetical protein